MNFNALPDIPALGIWQRRFLIVGGAGLLALLAGAFLDRTQFYQSYLLGFLFWSSFTLGCMGIVMLQHLTGGAWGIAIRRILEAGTRTLPVVALLFVPVLLGMKELFIWARPDEVAADPLLQHKEPYLNVTFFVIRTVLYFAIWMGIVVVLNRWSLQQDARPDDKKMLDRFQKLSGAGLVLLALTMTFASVDWIMSLEPHWFSTIYGALFMAGQALAGFCLAITVLVLLGAHEPFASVIRPTHYHDLGKLLLAFVMVWAYFGFSQFLIIWSGNLPEEIPWYLRRLQGGWQWIGTAVFLMHFVLPFFLLLSRDVKRSARLLARVAVLVIFTRLVDIYWLTAPAFSDGGLSVHWMDIAAPVGIGGLWLAIFLRTLQQRPLLPAGDPFLEELVEDAAR